MVFDPERFINKETGECVSSNNLIPFSIGKRYCLGQSLAEQELFLFLTGLVKAFKFEAPQDEPLPECGYHDGGPKTTPIRSAPMYKILVKTRK